MKPRELGKIVHDYISRHIPLRNHQLKELYDSTPDRIFNGQDRTQYSEAIEKDILVLKNKDACFWSIRPVVVVDGYVMHSRNNTVIGKYKIRLYFDGNNDTRTAISQDVIKSNLEDNFKKLSVKTIDEAIKYYVEIN